MIKQAIATLLPALSLAMPLENALKIEEAGKQRLLDKLLPSPEKQGKPVNKNTHLADLFMKTPLFTKTIHSPPSARL